MRTARSVPCIFALALVVALIAFIGCGEEGLTYKPSYESASYGFASSSFWVLDVLEDGRENFDCDAAVTGPASHIIGNTPSTIVSLGPTSGNFLTVEMEQTISDGPGDDLVVHEVGSGGPGAFPSDFYKVYLSNTPSTGFVLIADVNEEGSHAIDISGSGISAGRFVRLEQVNNVVEFDPDDPCATYGADFSGVEGLNSCPSLVQACAAGGEFVDLQCPPDDSYRNHGEYMNCVAQAANEYVESLGNCFSEEDLEEIHGCIVSARAKSRVGGPSNGRESVTQ